MQKSVNAVPEGARVRCGIELAVGDQPEPVALCDDELCLSGRAVEVAANGSRKPIVAMIALFICTL